MGYFYNNERVVMTFKINLQKCKRGECVVLLAKRPTEYIAEL